MRILAVLALASCGGGSSVTSPRSAPAGVPATRVVVAPPTNGARFAVGAPAFGLGASPRELAFSPDGHLLAGCGKDGTARVWEVPGGREHARIELGWLSCTAIAFGPDGIQLTGEPSFEASELASGAFDPDTGQPRPQRVPIEQVTGPLAASASARARLDRETGSVVVRKSTGEALCTIPRTEMVEHLALSPDGSALAIASLGGRVERFALPACTAAGAQTAKHLAALAYAPDGTLRAAVATHTGVAVWTWPFDQPGTLVTDDDPVPLRAALSPDGRFVAIARELGAEVVEIAAPRVAWPHHRDEIASVAVWDDGTVITASPTAAFRWTEQGQVQTRVPVAKHELYATALDAAGTRLAEATVGDGGKSLVYAIDVVDLATLAELPGFLVDRKSARGLAWAGDRLLVATEAAALEKLRDADVRARPGLYGMAWIAASPDGAHLVAARQGGMSTTKLDVFDGDRMLGTLPDDVGATRRAAIGATRLALAVEHDDLRHRPTWQLAVFGFPALTVEALAEGVGDGATAVALRGDDRLVVGYVDGKLRVLAADGKVAKTLASGAGRVTALDVSPDGKRVVSVHADGPMYVWDL